MDVTDVQERPAGFDQLAAAVQKRDAFIQVFIMQSFRVSHPRQRWEGNRLVVAHLQVIVDGGILLTRLLRVVSPMLLAVIAMTTMVSPAQTATQADRKCTPQALPPAIDSAGEPPIASDVIEFGATPALQYPGKAWVVRVSRRGSVEAKIEIVRLRRQFDCNRYDIEARWQAPLQQAEYAVIAERIAPVGVPAASVFVPSSPEQLPELVTDGTGVDLRLQSAGWRVTRSSNHYAPYGRKISSIFRDIASNYVPASELPADDWRTLPLSPVAARRSPS